MNQGKCNLLCTILLTLSAIAILQINPLSLDSAIAKTSLVPAPSLQKEPTEILTARETELPPKVQSALLEAAACRTSQTVSNLRILEAQPRNWSDGCLELAKPNELCTQVVTPGWRVVVTDSRRTWTYRTDKAGDVTRLEKSPQ